MGLPSARLQYQEDSAQCCLAVSHIAIGGELFWDREEGRGQGVWNWPGGKEELAQVGGRSCSGLIAQLARADIEVFKSALAK